MIMFAKNIKLKTEMKNIVIKLFLNAIAVVIASYVLSGVHVDGFGWAVIVALTLALLNVALKPVLIIFTLPVTIFSLGLFLLFINAIIIKIAAYLIGAPGFSVDGWWSAFLFSIILAITNSLLERLVSTERKIIQEEPTTKIYDKDGNRIV